MGWLQNIGGAIGNAWHDVTGGESQGAKNTRNILGIAAGAAMGGFVPGVSGLSIGGAGNTLQAALQSGLGASSGGVSPMFKGAAGKAASSLTGGNALSNIRNIAGIASLGSSLASKPVSPPDVPNLNAMAYGSGEKAGGGMVNDEFQKIFNRRISELSQLDSGVRDSSTYDKLLAENQTKISEQQAEAGRYGSSDTDQRRTDASAAIQLAEDQYFDQKKQTVFNELMNIYGLGSQADQIKFNQSLQQAGLNLNRDNMIYQNKVEDRRGIESLASNFLSTPPPTYLEIMASMNGNKKEEENDPYKYYPGAISQGR